ncbi:MAG TPA: radical SAM family heme chaperone HemW [Candidatus Eisenbacteria bacterium]|nr:radical SAM family heme chaperone HemW [Candidatus Eisenbacteria bacterium]
MNPSLYIHIPYCRSICPYCAFATAPLHHAEPDRFLGALDRELRAALAGDETDWRRPRTLYVGGGTPTALDPASLRRFLAWVRASFDLSAAREWTVEANPEGLTDEKLAILLEAGVDRLSLGVQSLEPAVLKTLGRIHTAEKALDAVERARRAGVPRVSVDLMVAVPGETADGIARGVEAVVARGVTHLSAYSLQVEERTPFAAKVARGALSPPGDDAAADRYALLDSLLLPRGFLHYEVSNYSMPGEASRHNEGYWIRRPYLGLGPGAHSFDGRRRWANEHDTSRYLDRVEREGLARDGVTTLGSREAAEEEVFLALRRSRGIHERRLRRLAGAVCERWIVWGEAAGALVRRPAGRVRPTARGLLTAHELAAELFAMADEAGKRGP